jgi:aconitate hydratase
MGQAPAIGRNSLRTFPRNFPGRSGTPDDLVWLCSPETAAAAALTGVITDPRELPDRLGIAYPTIAPPITRTVNLTTLERPLPAAEAAAVELVKAPSIGIVPDFEPLPDDIEATVAIKVGDDVSTDEILPAGAKALPYRSNIPKLAEFAFVRIDPEYVQRARQTERHVVVAGRNYGQGSSREHAAIVPRYLGLCAVLAKSHARIHSQNLANFGVIPLEFVDEADYDRVEQGDTLTIAGLAEATDNRVDVVNVTQSHTIQAIHRLSSRQLSMALAGGRIAEHRRANLGELATGSGGRDTSILDEG